MQEKRCSHPSNTNAPWALSLAKYKPIYWHLGNMESIHTQSSEWVSSPLLKTKTKTKLFIFIWPCWVLALACQILVALFGIFHCGMQDQLPTACRIPVPQTGIKPRSPALQSRLWTTEPPGKSQEEYCGLWTTDLSVNRRVLVRVREEGRGFLFLPRTRNIWMFKVCQVPGCPTGQEEGCPLPQVSRAEVRKVGFPWRAVPVIP